MVLLYTSLFCLPVIVHNSFKHSSRLLVTDNVFCISAGASNSGNINAPIIEYSTTNSTRPGVENTIRNVKLTQRFELNMVSLSSAPISISSSTCSTSDILQQFTANITSLSLFSFCFVLFCFNSIYQTTYESI